MGKVVVPVDLDRELVRRDAVVQSPRVAKRLKDSHHDIARLLAQDCLASEITAITGYSQSRISTLKTYPEFRELVEFYRGHLRQIEDQVYADAAKRLAAVRNDAIEEIHDRLLDTPDLLSTDQIVELIKMTSDRTGYGPQSKSTNLNVTLDLADRVAAGRQRLERLSEATPRVAELPGTVTMTPPHGVGDGGPE